MDHIQNAFFDFTQIFDIKTNPKTAENPQGNSPVERILSGCSKYDQNKTNLTSSFLIISTLGLKS